MPELVGARQLAHDGWLGSVKAALALTGVDARNITLEITERASLEHHSSLVDHMRALRALGYRIAVDDLGAGYAGLSYFARLAPDVVKIDVSLTRDVDRDPVRQRIVASICTLAHDLGMLVVAEGIETQGEFVRVGELGVDLVQGYFVARPGPYRAG